MADFNALETAVKIFGGLGLFIYGMHVMAEGLENAAGNKMRNIIEILTKNRFIAVFVGALVTAIIQSSSATTVMVVGFVNAGIMNLVQSAGIIMGANIGTTVTAILVSLNLTKLAPVAIGAGMVILLSCKREKSRRYAQILIGFGILFTGMSAMKQAVKPLREWEGLVTILSEFGSGSFADTIAAMFAGFAVTAVIQSSSATTGIMIALATQGLLPIEAAFPVLLGTNIGTCVTAMLSSMGASRTAKRAALIHLLFNVIGAVIFALFFSKLIIYSVKEFSVFINTFMKFMNVTSVEATQLAAAHFLFNLLNTVIMLPFISVLVFAVTRIIPVTESEKEIEGIKYLDERFLVTPPVALSQVGKEVIHMGEVSFSSLKKAIEGFLNSDSSKSEEVFRLEKAADKMKNAITDYLVKLSNLKISIEDRETIDNLFSIIKDMERISDHAENIAELTDYSIENKLVFSDAAVSELEEMGAMSCEMIENSLKAVSDNSAELADKVMKQEPLLDSMEKKLRKEHIMRLNEGNCSPSSGIVFLDLIRNLERVGDHADNLAVSVIDPAYHTV